MNRVGEGLSFLRRCRRIKELVANRSSIIDVHPVSSPVVHSILLCLGHFQTTWSLTLSGWRLSRPNRPHWAVPSQVFQALKSAALIGGSSAAAIAVGIVRNKAMAMLLGPAGIGLMGVYASIADVVRSVAQMGVNSSGVRQIAEAVASEDDRRIARTVMALRRIAVGLALLGALAMVACLAPDRVVDVRQR